MAPKLYSILASPPVRSVLLCAKALELDLEVVTVNLFEGEHLTDDFLKKNPQHTLPVLEDDDGFIVCDSHAIMGYLVAKYGKDDALYPKNDYKQRSIIDHRMHFDCSTLFFRGFVISRPLLFDNVQPTQEKIDDLREAYEILEQILAANKTDYVAGNSLSIADFSIITCATSWSIFAPYTDLPHVKAYVQRMQKLPYYNENQEGLTIHHELINAKLKK